MIVLAQISLLGPILAWSALAAVPFLIVLLYFLKLRRQPVEVPSTYLWARTIEDLHVNTIWQKLRKNLLLFLQLLFVLLIILACLPWAKILQALNLDWNVSNPLDARIVLLVDASASMSATDEGKSRLAIAKDKAGEIIDRMGSDNVAMIISFSDGARVEQSFTNDRSLLRRKLRAIEQTEKTSNLEEALRAAAGLANPGRTSQAGNMVDVQVAEALPATMYMFTDGGVSSVPDFNLGNLQPQYVPIGNPVAPENVAIINFAARENPEQIGQYEAFAELQNCGIEDRTVDVTLYVNDELWDAKEGQVVAADDSVGLTFDLTGIFDRGFSSAVMQLDVDIQDDMLLDNRAFAVLNEPRPGRVLFVTSRNEPLELALQTSELSARFLIDLEPPAFLDGEAYRERAATGYYDLVLFDRCAPEDMPNANSVSFGAIPPVDGWTQGEVEFPIAIIDTAQSHPLMHLIEMRPVLVVEAFPVEGPAGSSSLIDSNIGSLMTIAPRGGYQDAVLGFSILSVGEDGEFQQNTDWPRHLSFPVFVHNLLEHMAGGGGLEAAGNVKPGSQVKLRPELPIEKMEVTAPSGRRFDVRRDVRDNYLFDETEWTGVYDVSEPGAAGSNRRFAVNLFDSRESDLRLRDSLEIGHEEVKATRQWQSSFPKLWKWLLVAGLIVLMIEWYIYNKRVYL